MATKSLLSQTLKPTPALGADEVAFLKAAYLNLDLADAAARYLGTTDARIAKRRHKEIRARALLRAQRADRLDLAKQLQHVPPIRPPTPPRVRESFDDFVLRRGYTDWRFSEQVEAYEAEVPQPAPHPVSALLEAALDAVDALAKLVDRPTTTSLVAWWFQPRLAGTLRRAHVKSLGDFTVLLKTGPRWFDALSGVGAVKAARMLAFLDAHRATLGEVVPGDARVPSALSHASPLPSPLQLAAPGTAVAPLERLAMVPSLDGSNGSNRGDRAARINATNDLAAIQFVLSRFAYKPKTLRAYRKELERALLWAVVERGKAFSSLNTDDANAYVAFMQAPSPAERWIASLTADEIQRGKQKKKVKRFSAEWRPFAGPLSPESIKYAVTVLKSACETLVEQRYLDSNPFSDVALPPPSHKPQFAKRHLPQPLWETCQALWLADRNTPDGRRRCAMVLLAYSTGLRASEIAAATTEHLTREQTPDAGVGYFLTVIGKGNKVREVVLLEWLLPYLVDHWTDRGLVSDDCKLREVADIAFTFDTPIALIGSLDGRRDATQTLSPATIYEITQDAFTRVINRLEKGSEEARKLVRASTHWLRHTYATHASQRGTDLSIIQENCGHASIETTGKYRQTDKSERLRAANGGFPGPTTTTT